MKNFKILYLLQNQLDIMNRTISMCEVNNEQILKFIIQLAMSSQNSSISDFQSPTRTNAHTLCNELGDFGFGIWKKQDINSSISLGEQSNQDTSIIEQKTPKQFENEPQLNLQPYADKAIPEKVEMFQDQQQQRSNNQEDVEQDTGSNPKTLTLIEDELLSRQSCNISSKISQYNSEVDNQCFASFLGILQSSYEVVLKNFNTMFLRIDTIFTEKFNKFQSNYLGFLRVKYIQNKKRISDSKMINLGSRYVKNQVIYNDCEETAAQIRNKISRQCQDIQQLNEILDENVKSLTKIFTKIKSIKQKKTKEIHFMDQKLRAITQQMTDLMIPKNRKLKKKQVNSQVFISSYVRTKYLMTKEKTFLHMLAEYLKAILNFISFLSLDAEPKLNLAIKECLVAFADGIQELKPSKFQQIQKSAEQMSHLYSFQEVYAENIKLLQSCIPESILPSSSIKVLTQNKMPNGEKLHKLIELLIKESQLLIYIPCLEVDEKDYYYCSKHKATVHWKKQNNESLNVEEKDLKVEEAFLIITIEGHLIIQIVQEGEQCQKIALLNLSELKISKNKNQIIISHKGKGVLGYLLSANSILGIVKFEPLENSKNIQDDRNFLINEFINKVKQVLTLKKEHHPKHIK